MKHTHTLDADALQHVCPRLSDREARKLARDLGSAIHRFVPGIGPQAAAHLIGQMAHESGEFRWSREIWGPTAVQSGYWRRRELQGDGPLWPGLGWLTRGGGWIQTTGRDNFRRAAKRLGRRSWKRLAARAGRRDNASLLALVWWSDHFPSRMPPTKWTVERVTRIVNGGTNGLDERRKYTERAMDVRRQLVPRRLKEA